MSYYLLHLYYTINKEKNPTLCRQRLAEIYYTTIMVLFLFHNPTDGRPRKSLIRQRYQRFYLLQAKIYQRFFDFCVAYCKPFHIRHFFGIVDVVKI